MRNVIISAVIATIVAIGAATSASAQSNNGPQTHGSIEKRVSEGVRESREQVQRIAAKETAKLRIIRLIICSIQQAEEQRVECRSDIDAAKLLIMVTVMHGIMAEYYAVTADRANAEESLGDYAKSANAAQDKIDLVNSKWLKKK